MNFQTKSRKQQYLAWLWVAIGCLAAYVLSVSLFGTGKVTTWYAPEQMRFFLPFALVFGFVAYELRWDGIKRELKSQPTEAGKAQDLSDRESGATEPAEPTKSAESVLATPPLAPEVDSAELTSTGAISDLKNDAASLELAYQAAAAGSVQALEKISEYALGRGQIVEAYFWMSLAELQGFKPAHQQLLKLRRKWMLRKCPTERENVHKYFSEEQGSVARALLRIACGYNVALARQRLRKLADSGHPDAQRFYAQNCASSGAR